MSEHSQTIEEFLRTVRASGLVVAASLEQAIEPWKDATGSVPSELLQVLIDKKILTQWQIDQLQKGKHKGFILGKYKLLRLLGAGGMSSVYLAEHLTLHQTVAIKVLPVKRVDQSSYLARFEREAQASARLNHPNIARAFDLDTSGSIHFIVMEHVDGIDLHLKVKHDGPLEVRDAADFIRQAALGLHYAHEEGLIHRDIKPANLILDKRGTIKILDLGLALAANDDDDASLTREHDEKVLGTADYLAPEQARDSHKADRRSDIYSLGCTLYYSLVGQAPFAKGTLAERIRAHMNQQPPNLLEIRPDVPAPIVELYFRMLEKHSDARQQSAQEIADALSAWLAATAGSKQRQPLNSAQRPLLRRPVTAEGGSGSMAPHRTTPLGPVVRSGPSSSSSSSVKLGGSHSQANAVGSDANLSSLSFTPPPSSAARSTQKRSSPASQASAKASGKASGKGAGTAGSNAGVKNPSSNLKKYVLAQLSAHWKQLSHMQIGGLPLSFWAIVCIGLIAVAGLAAKVLRII